MSLNNKKLLFIGNIQGFNNAHKYYLTEQRLINGFTRLGHNIYSFNDRDHARYCNILRTQSLGKKHMNQTLLTQCIGYSPDLIILSHCKNVHNDTLLQIREALPNIKITYTNVDPLSVKQNIQDIKQRVGVVDTIFITTGGKHLKQFSDKYTRTYFFPNPVDKAIDTKCSFKNQNANIDLLFLGHALNHQHDHRNDLATYTLKKIKQTY